MLFKWIYLLKRFKTYTTFDVLDMLCTQAFIVIVGLPINVLILKYLKEIILIHVPDLLL